MKKILFVVLALAVFVVPVIFAAEGDGPGQGVFTVRDGFPPFALGSGSFSMTGSSVGLNKISKLKMDPATYTIDGKPIDLKYSWYRGSASSNYQFPKQRRQF